MVRSSQGSELVVGGGGRGRIAAASAAMFGGGFLVLPEATADRDIAEGSACSPVAFAVLAEMAGLRRAVVVEVAELGVEAMAPRASHRGLIIHRLLVILFFCRRLICCYAALLIHGRS